MRMRNRVRLQKSTATRDAAGQPIESWSTYRTCFASVAWREAREFAQSSGQMAAVRRADITIRTPRQGPLPDPLDRVLVPYGSTTLVCNVQQVIPLDQRRRMTRLVCQEDTP